MTNNAELLNIYPLNSNSVGSKFYFHNYNSVTTDFQHKLVILEGVYCFDRSLARTFFITVFILLLMLLITSAGINK